MQSQKVLGIPLLTFFIIIIAFCGITYYASSYASENSLILKKYQATRTQLLTSQSSYVKLDKMFKICTSNLRANEESNRELTLKIQKSESLLKKAQEDKNKCQSQVSSLHQFYLKMREHAGLMDDNDQMNTGDVNQAEIEEVTQTLKDKQAKSLKDEKEKCKRMIQTELESAAKNTSDKAHELEKLQAKNNELKEEVASVRKLLEEKDLEISRNLREKERPGFQQKQTKPENPNVKMIDLNVAKRTEPPKKESVSEKAETTKPATIPTISTTVQPKQTKLQANSSEGTAINQKKEVTESGNTTASDKVTTEPKPSPTEIIKNDKKVEEVEEGETDKRIETDEDADFDDHFDNDTR